MHNDRKKYNKAIEGRTRESVKAEVRPSGSAGDSASLSLSVQPYCFVAACAWLRRAQRAALVIDKHTPQCQLNKFCGLNQNDNYLKNFNYSL